MAENTNIVEFKEGWKDMQEGIKKVKMILEGMADSQFSSDEYMKLYTTIYNMSTQTATYNCCFQLYNKYKETFVEYITSTVLPCLREKHDEFLLMEFVKRWSNHKVMIKWLCRFFCHLDRYYIVLHAYTMLNDAAIICFRDLAYKEVHVNVRDAVITLIGKEREGEQIDRALLKNALGIFVEIGLGKMERYEQDFEAYLLEETAAYYSRKASKWIVEDSYPDYLLKCEECLNKERDRESHYLHSSSETKLLVTVQHELLVVHSTALLIDKEHSGCMALLRHDKVEDLSRMFRLCCIIPKGLELIAKIFHKHIAAECTALFQQAQADDAATNQDSNVAFILKVIELHDKYMVHVTDCFQNHSLLLEALIWAFKVFFNKTVKGRSSAELLVNFCDNILLKKGGTEKLSDETIEETLEQVVNLVDYIDDKDFFAEFHRKKLACRLLSDRLSANGDLERSILINLKQQLGAHFTAKMEGMLTDMTLAWENKLSFEDYLWKNSSAEHPGIDLTVSVLTTRFWPSYTTFDLNLPPEMLKCVQAFESFYKTKSRNKKLVWLYSQGTCIVNGNFEQIPIELVVSPYQAAVLLLFNDSDRLSYSEIVEQLDLPHDHDLNRVLHSLSCSKYKILLKEPNTNSFSNSDIFVFNSKFTDRMRRRRIKIPLPSIEEQKVEQHVNLGRRYAIECVIVRIMKSRKVLEQQQLISECIKQLSCHFKPDVETIKTQIDYLIARGFLERDQKEPNMFKYLP